MEIDGFNLRHKARTDADPHSKTYIYFTGHPMDIDAYFEEVGNDILQTQNCIFFCDSQPDAPRSRDELEALIDQMKLIVIPITDNFLYQENRARDMEYPLATQLQKPILFWAQTNLSPIQTEAFNERCRKVQALIKNDRDPAPISYETKLAQFLESNLVTGNLADRVRSAFDAYIFLSYRKKDRIHVKRLMETIHQDDSLQDVAIWYDEFLTIGESFDTAIKAAMEKSKLITLLVTPNVLEPKNFVKDTEYPFARDLPRPVIPVIAEETNRAALAQGFDSLPDCIPIEDASSLAQTIHSECELSKPEGAGDSQHSPEHDYLIGLAYLNGIDVERDTARGIRLITRAAEQDFAEAVERLVEMYRIGNGVASDCVKAIEWQRRLAEIRWEAYQNAPSEDRGILMLEAYCDLGGFLRELPDLEAAIQTYQEVIEIGKPLLNGANTSARIVFEVVKAQCLLADIISDLGDLPKATAYYRSCGPLLQKWLQEEDGTDIDLRIASSNYVERMGSIFYKLGDTQNAISSYQQALKLASSVEKECLNEASRNNLAIVHEDLGDVYSDMGCLDEAEEHYSQSIQLLKKNLAEYQTDSATLRISVAFSKMGDLYRSKDDSANAMYYYMQSMKGLSQQNICKSADSRLHFAFCLKSAGQVCYQLGLPKEAHAYLEHAVEILRPFAEKEGMVDALHHLSRCYNIQGDIFRGEENLEEAERLYREALQTGEQFADHEPTIDSHCYLADLHQDLGVFYAFEWNDPEKARPHFERSVFLYQGILEGIDVPKYRYPLGRSYYNLGIASVGTEREEYGRKAYKIAQDLLRDDPDNEEYQVLRDRVLKILLQNQETED